MATYSDDFNRTNASTLGTNWSQGAGTTGITSNQAVAADTSYDECWYTSSCSGNDNYAEVTVPSGSLYSTGFRQVRVECRGNGTSTGYCAVLTRSGGDWIRDLVRRVSDADTSIVSPSTAAVTLPATIRVEASGSTIRYLFNGSELFSVTDTGITTGVRVGLTIYDNTITGGAVTADDWAGGDLGTSVSITATAVSGTSTVQTYSTRNALLTIGGESKQGIWT